MPDLNLAKKPVLTGEKVVLRPVRAADAPGLAAMAADPQVAQLTGTPPRSAPPAIEDLRQWRWLAYTLRMGNLANVYVEPSPATGAKYQITTGNGHHPVWLPDGKGLSYRVSGNQQVVVSINTKTSFSIGNPVPAIAGGLPTVLSLGSRSYDITPDGATFLTVTAASGSQPSSETREIQIVLNWSEELKRLVPPN